MNTDDRELLMLAAKAAGYTLTDHYGVGDVYWPWVNEECEYWQPLEDDGDALRLAVKLSLGISIVSDSKLTDVITFSRNHPLISLREMHGDDPYAATRRAIVRAAAEIGMAMP